MHGTEAFPAPVPKFAPPAPLFFLPRSSLAMADFPSLRQGHCEHRQRWPEGGDSGVLVGLRMRSCVRRSEPFVEFAEFQATPFSSHRCKAYRPRISAGQSFSRGIRNFDDGYALVSAPPVQRFRVAEQLEFDSIPRGGPFQRQLLWQPVFIRIGEINRVRRTVA